MPEKNFNQIVIGGGSAGLITAYISNLVGAKCALIEKSKMGGDCLNSGCVPSKTLIKSAKIAHQMRKTGPYGIKTQEPEIQFDEVMRRVQRVIKKIEPHDSKERYEKMGVSCFTGEAQILSPNKVKVNDQVITTQNITIATGARPVIPKIPGVDHINTPLTSENIWELTHPPESLMILGGGPIGCELAQAFNRLGIKTVLIERSSRLLNKEDPEASKVILKTLSEEGVDVYLNTEVSKFLSSNIAKIKTKNEEQELHFDRILFALGRKANTEGLNLESLKLEYNKNGTLKVDPYLRTTRHKNIFACGDVAGPYQFTHAASHQAWYASVNSLFAPFKMKTSYQVLPRVTYTSPEVASVGKTEVELKKSQTPYVSTTFSMKDLDRALIESETKGFVRVFTKKGSDKILGACITASSAGEMLTEFTFAMRHKKGLNAVMSTIHPYPTFSEANKSVAGLWKNKTKPEKVLTYLKKFFEFRRKYF